MVCSRAFALAELLIVMVGGVAICLAPGIGGWAIAVSLIPLGFRLLAGESPFRRRQFDLLLAIFLLTAAGGYWASYDKVTALQKLYLIVVSILLYYALSVQPEDNLGWVAASFFCLGIGTAAYFLLTQDFINDPRRLELVNQIGRWVMAVRPVTAMTHRQI